jgi:hypothetical protein
MFVGSALGVKRYPLASHGVGWIARLAQRRCRPVGLEPSRQR